ncbi:MAG: hypothetical protein ACOYIQ_02345 [Christensenellales bacterium]|jgi:hypothetical protein
MSIELKTLIAIVPRGKGDEIVDYLRERRIFFNTVLLGKGTNTSRNLDLMGLGDSKKDVVLSAMEAKKIKPVMQELASRFRLEEPGRGVAFAVNINSISGMGLLKYITNSIEE